KSRVTDRLPLFRPAQYRLAPDGASGHRVTSAAPPTGSTRTTSAPSWASVMPPSGAATNEEISTIRSPASGAASSVGMDTRVGSRVPVPTSLPVRGPAGELVPPLEHLRINRLSFR